ncbi:MAG: hypothetical protein ABSA83_03725 [Verrucomicrobiota bacterium]
MKNQPKFINVMPRSGQFAAALAGLMLLAITASAPAAEVLPPSSLPYGLSYEEWSAKWWQWSLGQSTNHLELVGGPGICSGTAGSVRFLNGVYLPIIGGVTTGTNHVTVSAGTPLFFTILANYDDNTTCPISSFTTNTADQLAAEVAGEWSYVTATTCTIDGVAVAGLANPATTEYLVLSPPFSYTTADQDNVLAGFFGETCIPGGFTVYPAVAEGVYLMLSPLSPGRHTIHFDGVVTVGGTPIVNEDITYDITVEGCGF